MKLLFRQHEGLLAENVPTALQGGGGDLKMGMWRSANVDKLEIGRQIRDGRIGRRRRQCLLQKLPSFRLRIDARDNAKLRASLPSGQMAAQRHVSQSNDCALVHLSCEVLKLVDLKSRFLPFEVAEAKA